MPHWGLAPEACSPGCPASGQESSAGSWPFLLLLPSRTLLTAFISGTPHAPSTSDKVNGSEVGSNIGGWGRAGGSAEWKGKVKKNASRSQLRRSTWKGDDTLPHPRRPGSHRGCRTAPRNLSPSALEPPHLPPPTRPTPCAVTSRAGRGAEESGRCRCCFSGSGASAGNFPALRSKLSWSPPAAGWEGAQRGARGAGAARSPGTRPARRPAGAAAPPVCGPFPRARPSPQPPPPPRPRPAPPPPAPPPGLFLRRLPPRCSQAQPSFSPPLSSSLPLTFWSHLGWRLGCVPRLRCLPARGHGSNALPRSFPKAPSPPRRCPGSGPVPRCSRNVWRARQ